jgi:tripartite-type tricarboxylate transporter receptor subunit TctC
LPGSTAKTVVTKLYSETRGALMLPDVKERLAQMGAEGVGDTPEQFAAFVKAEIAKWAKVVHAAGIQVE